MTESFLQENGIVAGDVHRTDDGNYVGFAQVAGQQVFSEKQIRAMTLALNKSIVEGVPMITQNELLRISREQK